MRDLRFSLQGRYPSVVDLSEFRIRNTAVTMHGSALLAGAGITEREFIGSEPDAISERLCSYLDHTGLHPGRNHLIILDMEPNYPNPNPGPNDPRERISFPPAGLGRYEGDPTLQAALIQAYITRINVAREVLREKWPTIRLGLYGVVVPDGQGEADDVFQQRMRGYCRGRDLGMFDAVDYLVPVLYNRFGPSDVVLPSGDIDLDRLHRWIGRATHQAMSNSQRLTRRNARRIPLAPVLTFWVANRPSDHNDKVVAPETMSVQLEILQEYRSVKTIVFWSGPETSAEMQESGREPLDFNAFLAQVFGEEGIGEEREAEMTAIAHRSRVPR